ncbi:MAG: hypothetical protein ACFFE5_14755 [Candidatus Thorarchaeota archaeon]
MDKFLINLSELEKAIDYVKKIHSKSPERLINNVKEILTTAKKDFEKNIESIEKLNREEFELVKIISKNVSNYIVPVLLYFLTNIYDMFN